MTKQLNLNYGPELLDYLNQTEEQTGLKVERFTSFGQRGFLLGFISNLDCLAITVQPQDWIDCNLANLFDTSEFELHGHQATIYLPKKFKLNIQKILDQANAENQTEMKYKLESKIKTDLGQIITLTLN